jgi:hypothetical protein
MKSLKNTHSVNATWSTQQAETLCKAGHKYYCNLLQKSISR